MDKKILDTLTGQEIRELINKNEIVLQDLDSDTLGRLMNYEIDMICYGKGDVDLISECADIIEKRENIDFSFERFEKVIERTKAERVIIVDKKDSKPKIRIILKRTLLVAALASVLLFSSGCVLIKLGVDIFQYISNIVRQPEGAESDIDEFTFYHNGEAKKYATIEELVEAEDLNIMYPTKWPNGVEVESVRITDEINGNRVIEVVTNEINVNIHIEFSDTPLSSSTEDVYIHNEHKFYIKLEDIFVASCYYNNKKYYISANSREDLLFIINNLTE